MKIEITKQIKVKETIDIEFPYYFKIDLLLEHSDSIIYRKIDDNKCVSITVNQDFDGRIDRGPALSTVSLANTPQHQAPSTSAT
jgi:hypothetical protein